MRFSSFISKKAQKPSGWFGRIVMPGVFDVGNERLNRLVFEMLTPQPGDHILDLGCGTGKLVHEIAFRTDSCVVEGLDFSETMVAIARRRNKGHISKAKAVIHMGAVSILGGSLFGDFYYHETLNIVEWMLFTVLSTLLLYRFFIEN